MYKSKIVILKKYIFRFIWDLIMITRGIGEAVNTNGWWYIYF